MEEEIISSINTEVHSINENSIELINERIKKYPHNSIVWCASNFVEVRSENGIKTKEIWDLERILDNRKDDGKKCRYTAEFSLIDDRDYYVECLICKKIYNYHPSSPSCPEMFSHLITCHPNVFKRNLIKEKSNYCNYSRNVDEFTNKAHILIGSFIVSSHSSFNIVDNIYFKKLLGHLNENYVPPSRTTLSEKILPDMLEKIKGVIQKEINEAIDICLSIDGWKEPYTLREYYSLTCHYYKNNEIVSRVLKMSLFNEKSTSGNSANFIIKSIEEWNLGRFGKIVILSDNAPNIMNAINIAGHDNVGCCCHRYDLVIENVIKDCKIYEALIDKCQKICIKYKNTPNFRNMLNSIYEDLYGFKLEVITESEIRWFTELEMLNRILQLAPTINGITEAYADEIENLEYKRCYLESYVLTDMEIELIKFFIEVFQKMYDESISLSSETTPTLSEVIPGYLTLISYYKNMKSKLEENSNKLIYNFYSISISCQNQIFNSFFDFESSIIQNTNDISVERKEENKEINKIKIHLIEQILEKMNEKFIEKNNIMENENILVSTMLNPRFKCDYFEEEQEERMKNKFQSINMNMEENIGKYSFGKIKRKERVKNELEEYLKEECLPDDSTNETVKIYWESNKNIYPTLYKLSRKYLCLLASSCSSERLFSDASNYCTRKRTRMLCSTVEFECIIHSYILNDGIEFFFE